MSSPHRIHVLLGKALQAGQPSREFLGRLTTLADELQAETPPIGLALLGGQGEAEAAWSWLNQHHADLLPPKNFCFFDLASRDTIGNVSALSAWLQETGWASQVELNFISTSYHVDRLRLVDTYLRPQSLLNALRPSLADSSLHWTSAPFLPPQSSNPFVRCLAKIYLLGERLLPLLINLEGILSGTLTSLHPLALREWDTALATFQTPMLNSLNEAPPFETVCERVYKKIKQLQTWHRESLPSLLQTSSVHLPPVALLRDLLRELRTLTDLDQPHFDSLFSPPP